MPIEEITYLVYEEISKLDRLLVGLAASSNKTRLAITIALFDNMVTGGDDSHSMSFTELREVFGLEKSELYYHLGVLNKANFTKREVLERPNKKRYTSYKLTDEAINFLNNLDITEKTIKEYREHACQKVIK